jgi:hypothetical protein
VGASQLRAETQQFIDSAESQLSVRVSFQVKRTNATVSPPSAKDCLKLSPRRCFYRLGRSSATMFGLVPLAAAVKGA